MTAILHPNRRRTPATWRGAWVPHVLAALLVPAALRPASAQAPSPTLDQAQTQAAVGFWLDRALIRTQEFTPRASSLSRIDVSLRRSGPAGDVALDLRDPSGTTLWRGAIAEPDVVDGWNKVRLALPIALDPGVRYVLAVRSSASLRPDLEYWWLGTEASTYTAGIADVEAGRPGFDYAFRTYSDPAVRPPRLEFDLDGTRYEPGQTVRMARWRLAGGSQFSRVDLRVWVRPSGGTPLAVVSIDSLDLDDGSGIDLATGITLSLLRVTEDLPEGEWEAGASIVETGTGATLAAASRRFTVRTGNQ